MVLFVANRRNSCSVGGQPMPCLMLAGLADWWIGAELQIGVEWIGVEGLGLAGTGAELQWGAVGTHTRSLAAIERS